MKLTNDRLAVARAVRDTCTNVALDVLAGRRPQPVDIVAVIESEPEPEPLPAPTGPGWWWARYSSFDCPNGEWMVVEVFAIGEGLRVVDDDIDDFDAWAGPLVAPTAKGGAE